jgi:hypothetical protein
MELPPQCQRCRRFNPEYGNWCRECLPHQRWLRAIQEAFDEDQVRVRGYLYRIRPELPVDRRHPIEPTGGRGFGGAEWKVRFHDGRTVVTRDLWSEGQIPEEYREALPDNAVFIYERRWPPPSLARKKRRKS